ncbi:MAG TPA: diguanylate cyclase, partial [Thermoanaerobaculia bacterium]
MVAVLVLLQAAILIAVHFAGERTLRRNLGDELRVGSRVLDQILSSRGRQLHDTVRVLAADYAFREAIASGDRPTITDVLGNHGSRIDADVAFLVSLDGTVAAATPNSRFAGHPFPIRALMDGAEKGGEASALVSLDLRPYQLVIVPVLAPQPIAWVCMGFTIDEAVLTNVRQLAALEVSLWSATAGEKPLLISTLPEEQRGELLTRTRELPTSAGDSDESIQLGSEVYQTLLHPLRTADGSTINTLLQRSIEEARQPIRRLELQIFALSSAALVLALVAAVFFARGVSRPLRELAEGAERIERGDYSAAVEVRQDDEIGHLATAFDKMRTGIAEREDQIRFQATHDSLTGLPNRTLFLDRLAQAIVKAKRNDESVGMIMMDLDRFKEINDTLGHHFGDELLNEISRRLSLTLRESDTVARLGGDEFAVTFQARDASRATDVARRVGSALEAPFILGGV